MRNTKGSHQVYFFIPIVMYLWGEKAAPALYSLNFGFSFGAVISAQITRPFITPVSSNGYDTRNTTVFDNVTVGNTDAMTPMSVNASEVRETSRLFYPNSMASIIAILTVIALIIIYIMGPPNGFPKRQPKNEFCELLSPGSCAHGRKLYGAGVLLLLFLFNVLNVGGEKAYGDYIFSYAVDAKVSFSKDKAAHVLTVFYISEVGGRFFGIFVSHFIPIH